MRIEVPFERSYFVNARENGSLQRLVVAVVAEEVLTFMDRFRARSVPRRDHGKALFQSFTSARQLTMRPQLGLVLPEPGHWGASLEANLAGTRPKLQREAIPWAEAA